MTKFLFALILLTIGVLNLQAQAPEQDCINALQLDSTGVYTFSAYSDTGAINEPLYTFSCIFQEINSVWLKLYITSGGTLSFNICSDAGEDYDWALFNLTGKTCDSLSFATQTACNFSGSVSPTSCTGANGGANPQDQPVVSVLTGQEYYLLINRNQRGGVGPGFVVDFSASTSVIGLPTSIKEQSASISSSVYPNPAAQNITLKLNSLKPNQAYSAYIYNSAGVLVNDQTNITKPETTIDIATLATGLYTYRITTTNGKTAAGRFVKE